MASVKKTKGGLFKVVNSRTGVPVGTPNTFRSVGMARKRASQVKCRVKKICPR